MNIKSNQTPKKTFNDVFEKYLKIYIDLMNSTKGREKVIF